MRLQKTIIVMSLLIVQVLLFLQCQPFISKNEDPRGTAYAGTVACLSCHATIYDKYIHSNHYKTSAPANLDSLHAIIAIASHSFTYPDSGHISIEEKNGQVFQTYSAQGKEIQSAQFSIAFGSGEKAQTYGYWKGDQLFELPLTWFAGIRGWANSPGFSGSKPYFDRVIESRCFECHATYAAKTVVPSGALQTKEELDKSTILFGIDCERCHGPGAAHADWQQQHPAEHKAMYMTAIHSLSRQQQLDLCATCHSGNDRGEQQTIFAFKPGDTLSNFYFPDFGTNREPDVHGRQLQLLQASQCFQQSEMTCSSCHNTHENESSSISVFIEKCMHCHQQSTHAQELLKNTGITGALNCIDCHMPLQPSKSIYFSNGSGSKSIPYLLRTHRIAVYGKENINLGSLH